LALAPAFRTSHSLPCAGTLLNMLPIWLLPPDASMRASCRQHVGCSADLATHCRPATLTTSCGVACQHDAQLPHYLPTYLLCDLSARCSTTTLPTYLLCDLSARCSTATLTTYLPTYPPTDRPTDRPVSTTLSRPTDPAAAPGRFNERLVLSLAGCPNCLLMDDELNLLPTSSLVASIEPVPLDSDGLPLDDPSRASAAELKDLAASLADTQVGGWPGPDFAPWATWMCCVDWSRGSVGC
jgi:hypothetical protein